MRVERYGNGQESFLCLHGWSGSHRTFEPLAAELPAHVSLWCPNIPTGPSLEAITDQLERLARQVPGPLRIVGNCSGALFGLLLAERMRADQILMIDAFAYWPVYFRIFLLPWIGRYAFVSAFGNPVGRWLANASLAKHRRKTTDLTRGFQEAELEGVYGQLRLLEGIGARERFRGIRSRVRIAYGEKSFRAVRCSAAMWREVFPEAEIYEMAGAGHLPLLEAAGQLRRIIFSEEKPCRVR